jgi:ketosteroid isomerase-like protein
MSYNNEADAEAAHGRKRHKAFLIAHARDFPNDRWTVEAIVAAADVVACRWRFQATHAATGNPVDVRAADFFTVRNGRLTELRRFLDFEGFHEQLRRR